MIFIYSIMCKPLLLLSFITVLQIYNFIKKLAVSISYHITSVHKSGCFRKLAKNKYISYDYFHD